MALFPQSFIDEVRSASDIVAVISDTVSLRKAGNSYKGLCPFHSEKTPSFTVNRDKGFFHCFGCGAGGDVFKFVELQDKMGFQEAARALAQRFGVPIPELEAERRSAAERGGTRGAGQDSRAGRRALPRAARIAGWSTHSQVSGRSSAGCRPRRSRRCSSASRRRDATRCVSACSRRASRRAALHQRAGDQARRWE